MMLCARPLNCFDHKQRWQIGDGLCCDVVLINCYQWLFKVNTQEDQMRRTSRSEVASTINSTATNFSVTTTTTDPVSSSTNTIGSSLQERFQSFRGGNRLGRAATGARSCRSHGRSRKQRMLPYPERKLTSTWYVCQTEQQNLSQVLYRVTWFIHIVWCATSRRQRWWNTRGEKGSCCIYEW